MKPTWSQTCVIAINKHKLHYSWCAVQQKWVKIFGAAIYCHMACRVELS